MTIKHVALQVADRGTTQLGQFGRAHCISGGHRGTASKGASRNREARSREAALYLLYRPLFTVIFGQKPKYVKIRTKIVIFTL